MSGDTIVEQIFREVRAFRINDGPTEVHKWSLAEKIKARRPRAGRGRIMNEQALAGRIALVTGPSSGLGARFAHAAQLDDVVRAIEAAGGEVRV